ncbi:hypothetical protein EV651_102339 [Kribbella sp. VKM Ac-2571]|uniref:hypothetical protein n=1 Tax=Kribbella sp. VKM Ac-2571 TaxID=2512222 RepID=UPI00105E8C22|nr:hypothetical protein [Kribbella sp. VKM Ac-2571]TDO68418.1 hypothetical protein EV651_102339 [Kribbella sp. VKM Ac-2571]
MVLAVTVLVPWGIGRGVLRDTWFSPHDPAVFDNSVRTAGAYFKADYLGGLVVVGAVVAIVLLTGSLRGRHWATSIGLLLAVATVAGFSVARSAWSDSERRSSTTLATGEFPYQERIPGACTPTTIPIRGVHYLAGQWAPDGGGMFGGNRCAAIDFYRGWRHLYRYTLPTGQGIESAFGFTGATAAKASYVVVVTTQAVVPAKSRNYVLGFPLSTVRRPWTHEIPAGPGESSIAGEVMQLGPLVVVPEYWGQEQSGQDEQTKLTALNAATGKLVWTARCPRGAMTAGQAAQADSTSTRIEPIQYSCRDTDSGNAVSYRVGISGKLIRTE